MVEGLLIGATKAVGSGVISVPFEVDNPVAVFKGVTHKKSFLEAYMLF